MCFDSVNKSLSALFHSGFTIHAGTGQGQEQKQEQKQKQKQNEKSGTVPDVPGQLGTMYFR